MTRIIPGRTCPNQKNNVWCFFYMLLGGAVGGTQNRQVFFYCEECNRLEAGVHFMPHFKQNIFLNELAIMDPQNVNEIWMDASQEACVIMLAPIDKLTCELNSPPKKPMLCPLNINLRPQRISLKAQTLNKVRNIHGYKIHIRKCKDFWNVLGCVVKGCGVLNKIAV